MSAVDTFAAIAEAADQTVTSLSIVSDAQREQLFVGEFVRNRLPERFDRSSPISIVDADAWCATLRGRIAPGFAIAGPVLPRLQEWLPPDVRQLPEPTSQPRAAAVAAIAERLAAAGEFADPLDLEPFYLRKSSAEEKRDAGLSSE